MVREGLWRDEAISVYAAAAPSVGELLARNRISDYTPPLFNALLAGYSRVAGAGETSLKLFALALGLLNAAAATALAWELAGPMAGALTAAFAANNPILLEMSTELRAYSLSAFLCCASLWTIFRLRRRGFTEPRHLVLVAALLTLLEYAHLAGIVVAAVLGAWGLLAWRRKPSDPFGRRLTASALAAGAAFLPWLPIAWEQFRGGIPWDARLPIGERFASLIHRSREVLPIPEGFRGPWLFVALGALGVLAVVESSAARAGLRALAERLAVAACAGGAVWLTLGLFSTHMRYLTIPAALAAALSAVLAASLFEAGLEDRRRVLAWTGAAALAAAAFASRAPLYRERFANAPRSKSGVRDLCASRPFAAGELVVAAPDYFAPTLWYYCGSGESLRGFVNWTNPELFDPRTYAAAWNDPGAAEGAASRIDEALRASRAGRFALVYDESSAGPPLSYGRLVGELRARLAREYRPRPLGRFPGRLESVEAEELSASAGE